MRKGFALSMGLTVLGALAWVSPAQSAVVYRNINDDPTLPSEAIPNNVEIADDVTLAGTERVVTSFTVPTFNSINQNYTGAFTARFYNFGEDGLPTGAPIWTGTLPIANGTGGDRTLVFPVPNVTVPDTFAWSLSFTTTLPSTEDDGIGPLLNDVPTVGSSFNEFYTREVGGEWEAFFYGDQPGDPLANFQAEITAEVPEPATLGLFAIGAFALGARRRR